MGLATHPGHEIASAQQSGFGSMLSFEILGGTDAMRRFVGTVELFTPAKSLGVIESLVLRVFQNAG
jgi:cystathionine gamma-synthase